MGFPKGEIIYPGIKSIISADVVRCHGISPNPITITITPQKEKPKRTGDLVLKYGNTKVTVSECIVDQTQYRYDQNGYIWQLVILDRRWKWSNLIKGKDGTGRSMNGSFNVRMQHGPVELIRPDTKVSAFDLMQACLDVMGEGSRKKPYRINFIKGSDLYPELYFDHTNPAQALQQICEITQNRIILRWDDKVTISASGLTEKGDLGDLPNGPIIFDNFGAQPTRSPDEIHLVCGPTRFQADFYCEPVGDDIDGLVKPIDELSYKPALGWKYGDLLHFLDVPLFKGSIGEWRNYVRPRELAKASVYRKYRIKVDPNKAFSIPGYDKKKNIKNIREVLPIGEQLIEPTFDNKDGWFKPVETIVWGVFAYGHNNNTTEDIAQDGNGNDLPLYTFKPQMVIAERDPVTGLEIAGKNTTVIPNEDYDIDGETGIITFKNIAYRYGPTTVIADRKHLPAVIWLRCGVTVNQEPDPKPSSLNRLGLKPLSPVRHVEKYKMPTQTGGGILEIIDETLFVRYTPKYSPGRPDSISGVDDNLDIVKAEARKRLEAEAFKFRGLLPKLRTYAGWYNYEMNGAVHQICYHLGTDGKATMTVCLNDELTMLTMPYNERRFYEKNAFRDDGINKLLSYIREGSLPFSNLSNIGKRGR